MLAPRPEESKVEERFLNERLEMRDRHRHIKGRLATGMCRGVCVVTRGFKGEPEEGSTFVVGWVTTDISSAALDHRKLQGT